MLPERNISGDQRCFDGREFAGAHILLSEQLVDRTAPATARNMPFPSTSISFHKNIATSFLSEGLEILPSVDDGGGIDLLDAFEDSGLQFVEGLDPDVAQEAPGHLPEESLNDVQP